MSPFPAVSDGARAGSGRLHGESSRPRYPQRVSSRNRLEVDVPRTLSRLLLPVAVLLGSVTLPATPAVAQDPCASPGGVDGSPSISAIQYEDEDPVYSREVSRSRTDPFAEDAHDVVISGGGWGHGVGMSQYGAQGAAAVYGCTASQILSTYFPNTTIEGRNSRDELRLKLWTTDASGVTSVWAEKQTDWTRCDRNDTNCDEEPVFVQEANTTVRVSVGPQNFRIQNDDGVDVTVPDRIESLLKVDHDGTLIKVLQGAGDARASGRAIRWGTLEFDFADFSFGQKLFTTEVIRSGGASGMTADLPARPRRGAVVLAHGGAALAGHRRTVVRRISRGVPERDVPDRRAARPRDGLPLRPRGDHGRPGLGRRGQGPRRTELVPGLEAGRGGDQRLLRRAERQGVHHLLLLLPRRGLPRRVHVLDTGLLLRRRVPVGEGLRQPAVPLVPGVQP